MTLLAIVAVLAVVRIIVGPVGDRVADWLDNRALKEHK